MKAFIRVGLALLNSKAVRLAQKHSCKKKVNIEGGLRSEEESRKGKES